MTIKKEASTKPAATEPIKSESPNTEQQTYEQPISQKEVTAQKGPEPVVNTLITNSDDDQLTDQAFLNMSGEFVTVKGRKLRKSNKKESTSNLVAKREQPVQPKSYLKAKQQIFPVESKPKSNLDAKLMTKSFVKKEPPPQIK